MNRTKLAIAVFFTLFFSCTSHAGEWYFSLGAHQAEIRNSASSIFDPDTGEEFTLRISEENTKFSASLGYIINEFWAVEGSHVQLGEIGLVVPELLSDNSVIFQSVSTEWQSFGVGVIGTVPLGQNWTAGLTLGYSYVDVDRSTGLEVQLINGDNGNSAVYYGLGVNRDFGVDWGLAIEYKKFELNDSPFVSENLGLKLRYRF